MKKSKRESTPHIENIHICLSIKKVGRLTMNSEKLNFEDGYVSVNGLKLYYKRFGKGNRHKMITLHGGPGGTHDYLLPLADLVSRDYDIVFYDQYGCGRSEDPKKDEDYSLEHSVEEVEGIRSKFFGDSRVNIFGNSWGGMLALKYGVKYQNRIVTLTSSSGLSSVPDTVKEMRRLISMLPTQHRDAIIRAEETGNYNGPEYQAAYQYFMETHTIRIKPLPDEILTMFDFLEKRGTYLKMNGPNEFTIVGSIKDIDFTPELEKITVPVLITCGKFDEVTPKIAENIHERIKGSELVVFKNSSHLQFWEEREKYMDVLDSFVRKYDK
jgi:proline iminopeptidase